MFLVHSLVEGLTRWMVWLTSVRFHRTTLSWWKITIRRLGTTVELSYLPRRLAWSATRNRAARYMLPVILSKDGSPSLVPSFGPGLIIFWSRARLVLCLCSCNAPTVQTPAIRTFYSPSSDRIAGCSAPSFRRLQKLCSMLDIPLSALGPLMQFCTLTNDVHKLWPLGCAMC